MKTGEYLLIGNDIKITFQNGGSNSVSIGVSAPKSMKVTRSKLYEKIVEEKAAKGDKKALEISQAINAEKFDQEQEIQRKERISQHIKECKTRQKEKRLNETKLETAI